MLVRSARIFTFFGKNIVCPCRLCAMFLYLTVLPVAKDEDEGERGKALDTER